MIDSQNILNFTQLKTFLKKLLIVSYLINFLMQSIDQLFIHHKEKEEYYSEFLFCFREELFYLVDDEFPKLTRRSQLGDIPLQVTSVNYEINLNGPTPQVLDDNAVVVDLIRRMANG